MTRHVIVIMWFLLECVNGLHAQNPWWEHTDQPFSGLDFYITTATDTTNHVVYAGDYKISTNPDEWGIIKYDGQNWDTVVQSGNTMAMAYYKGNLYVGAEVVGNPGEFHQYFARYNGETWEGLGDNLNESVSALKVIDDTLYVGGFFSATDSFPYSYVAKYDGEHWYGIPNNPFLDTNYSAPWIMSFASYQGSLYIGGNFVSAHGADLTMYSDGIWHQPGQGIMGFASSIKFLEEYHGELYAAGAINQNEGNAGNYIQKWDGESWSQVGSLLHNDPAYIAGQILSMMKYNNALYIEGKFEYAGNTQVNDLARWDGTRWCGMHHLPESLNGYTYTSGMFALDSSMYFRIVPIPGDSFFYGDEIYQWIGGDNYGPCVSATGLGEVADQRSISVTPNPANNYVFIENPTHCNGDVIIATLTGRIAVSGIHIKPGEKKRIDLSTLPSALYIVHLQLDNGQTEIGKLIKL